MFHKIFSLNKILKSATKKTIKKNNNLQVAYNMKDKSI